MTRKDYELIAATLKAGKPSRRGAAYAQWRMTVADFGAALASTNPRFDLARFILACGEEI